MEEGSVQDKKRRSSILKRNILDDNNDNTEILNETAAKQIRRVSFASTNTIKPFVKVDDDKDTLWDTTYEEDIKHIDSTGCGSDGSTKCNTPLLLTNVENYVSIKENVQIIEKENLKPPIVEQSESIINFVKRKKQLKLSTADCNLEISQENPHTNNCNTSNHQSSRLSDMDFTCGSVKINNDISIRVSRNSRRLSQEQFSKKSPEYNSTLEFTCINEKSILDSTNCCEMEVTNCQLESEIIVSNLGDNVKRNIDEQSENKSIQIKKVIEIDDNTYICNKNEPIEQGEGDMEITLESAMNISPRNEEISENKVNIIHNEELSKKVNQLNNSNSELCSSFPLKLPILNKNENLKTDDSSFHMNFTNIGVVSTSIDDTQQLINQAENINDIFTNIKESDLPKQQNTLSDLASSKQKEIDDITNIADESNCLIDISMEESNKPDELSSLIKEILNNGFPPKKNQPLEMPDLKKMEEIFQKQQQKIHELIETIQIKPIKFPILRKSEIILADVDEGADEL